MSVPTINLLPAKRVSMIRARAAARWWILGGLAYCVAVFAGATAYSVSVTRERGSDDHAETIVARLDAARAEKQSLTTRVTDLRKRVEAARAVGHHPDWSVMLRHLAEARPDSLVLEKCELKRLETTIRTPAAGGQPETTRTQAKLQFFITGTAGQMTDVHTFVARVEESAVFDVVRLGETSVVGGDTDARPVTRFTVQCELVEPMAGGQE